MEDYELQERQLGKYSMHTLCEEVTASRDGREVMLVFFGKHHEIAGRIL
jgi:hypothetical protein